MNDIKRLMIVEFRIREIGHDFMGYSLNKNENYNYHHIEPRRLGGEITRENGAILVERSHQFIHTIETRDECMYQAIQAELLAINRKGYVDPYNVRIIHELLREFEEEHKNDLTRKGKPLIKEKFYDRKKF